MIESVCCVGAGGLGGYMSAKLAAGGVDVTVVDVGEHQAAIQRQGGLLVSEPDSDPVLVPLKALEIADVGTCDVVILGVKAMDLPAAATASRSLLHDETIVVTAQNGIPWWYFHRHGGPMDGTALHSLDPDGVLDATIDPARIIGCVAYPAMARPSPGEVQLVSRGRFPVGELDGSQSERVVALYELFEQVGLKSRVLDDVRSEIWLKALGSVSLNPISALTGATLAEICTDPKTRATITAMMQEAEQVAGSLGITMRRTIEERIEGAAKVGAHKTSMLQDVEAGRPLELDALVGAIVELGDLVGIPTPTIDVVFGLVSQLDAKLRSATT